MHDAEIRVKTVVDTSPFTKLKDAMANIKTGIGKMATSMKQFGSVVKNVFKSAMTAVGNFVSAMVKGFAKVALVATIVGSLRKAIQLLKEGLENYAQASPEYNQAVSELKSNLEQLKNALASAFAPIVQMVIPYLNQFLTWLNSALEKVAMFFAVLNGQNYFLRAKKQTIDYAKSLKKVNDEAKGLSGIDQLNVLNSNKSAEDSSGGATTGGNAYEKVEIEEGDLPEWMQWVIDHLDIIKELAKDIGLLFLGWSFGGAFGLLVVGIYLIVTALKDWIETGELSDETFARLELGILAVTVVLAMLFGWIPLVVGAVVMLALAIYKNWDKIKEWTTKKFKDIADTCKKIWALIVGVFKSYGNAVKTAFIALWNVMKDKVTAFFNSFKTAVTNGLNVVKGKFESFKTGIVGVFNTIWDNVKKVINKILEGIEKMINGFITAINKFTSVLGNIANYVGEKLGLEPVDLTFSEAKLPRLATGGIVTSATTALIGESGREAVLPLESNTQWMDVLADKISRNMEVIFKVEGDPNGIFRVVQTQSQLYTRRTGRNAF